jgi:uncharacterized protein YjbJ (UPF0337 family)
MGIDDKVKHAVQDAAGKAKEALGKATDNPRLQAEGKADQFQAEVGNAEEKLKDKASETAEDLKDRASDTAEDLKDKVGDAGDDLRDEFRK